MATTYKKTFSPYGGLAIFSLSLCLQSSELFRRRRARRTVSATKATHSVGGRKPPPRRDAPRLGPVGKSNRSGLKTRPHPDPLNLTGLRNGTYRPPEGLAGGNSAVALPSCSNTVRLRRKARLVRRFFSAELGFKGGKTLPPVIQCGQLRSAITDMFGHLTVHAHLSIKTAQKLEKSYCRSCESTLVDREVTKWKEQRFLATSVDPAHLARFESMFRRNVDHAWNLGSVPYIPNGHASLSSTRKDGGTWVPEVFSLDVGVKGVVSSGKLRIVTLFSSSNSRTLYPLHRLLHRKIQRKGWLLKGEPTPEEIARLKGGSWISVDYSAATDSISLDYTRVAVKVLKEKAVGLTRRQCRALDVLYSYRIDGVTAVRGQPMGSLMSFPVLCLMNKTWVDMSLTDLLLEGKMSTKEWSAHRCRINGDDLLLRDVLSAPGYLKDRVAFHSGSAGVAMNEEKTMVHPELAEINSTLFSVGERQKKSNCGALFMEKSEGDVLGFADRSCLTDAWFLRCVKRALPQLSAQADKLLTRLPPRRLQVVLRDAAVRNAIKVKPGVTKTTNMFPVVPLPDGYALSAREHVAVIDRRVKGLQSRQAYAGFKPPAVVTGKATTVTVRSWLKRQRGHKSENLLQILADSWRQRQWSTVKRGLAPVYVAVEHVCDECAAKPLVWRMSCEIRASGVVVRPLP